MEVRSGKTTTSSVERENFLKEIITLTIESSDKDILLNGLATKIGDFLKADRIYFFNYKASGYIDQDNVIEYLGEGIVPVNFDELPLKKQFITPTASGKNIQFVLGFDAPDKAPPELQEFAVSNNIHSAVVYDFFFNDIPSGRFVLHSKGISDEERELLESILELVSNSIYKTVLLSNEKKARKNAEVTGNELQTLINSIPAFVSYVGKDLKFKYFNKVYSEVFGISEGDIKRKQIKDVIGEKTFRISQKMIDRVMNGEKAVFENEIKDKHGETRHLLVQYIPHLDENKEFNGFFVLGNDITSLKETEIRLEEKQERLRMAIEATNLGTWDHNFITGDIVFSDRAKQLLGFADNEEITTISFLKKIHKEDRKNVKDLIERAIMDESQKDYMMEFRTSEGKRLNASGRIFVGSENKTIRFLGLIRDMTDQRLHEDFLKNQRIHFYNIFHEAPSLIFVLHDEDLRIEYLNNEIQRNLASENLVGRKFEDVYPELVEQGILGQLKKVYSTGETITGKEILLGMLNKKGDLVQGYFNYVLHPSRNGEGDVDGVIIYANEITDLVNSRKTMESFLSMASHELKTPLTSIKAYANLIEEEINNHELKEGIEYMARMDANLSRLQNLINDLLDVSSIQSGKNIYHFTLLDYAPFVNDCIENLRLVYPKVSIELEITTKKWVHGDKERLEQVIINLVSNAIKYSPGKDQVWVVVSDDKDGNIVTEIRDQGLGIPEHNQKNLFQRFVRLDNKDYKSSGLGMGLYISKEIVLAHKGDIGVTSNPGKGSTFYFTIPEKVKD